MVSVILETQCVNKEQCKTDDKTEGPCRETGKTER